MPIQLECGKYDTSSLTKDSLMAYGWIVEGQLDPGILQWAWWRLLKLWPVLASRLREDPNQKGKWYSAQAGRWFYEVPTTEELEKMWLNEQSKRPDDKSRLFAIVDHRPAPVRLHYQFCTSRNLAQDRPSTVMAYMREDVWQPNAADSVMQLLKEDRAVVTVHIGRFADATLIWVCTPHVLCDGVGFAEIMEAWSDFLHGRGERVRPLKHLGRDAFWELPIPDPKDKSLPPPATAPGWNLFGFWDSVRFFSHVAWDYISRPQSAMEHREIYLPPTAVRQIKDQAMADLSHSSDSGQRWIATGDAVMAWLIKRQGYLYRNESRMLGTLFPANLRWTEPAAGLQPMPMPYLQNGVLTLPLPRLTGEDVSKIPLGELAWLIRAERAERTRPESVRQSMIWRLWACQRGGGVIFFTQPEDRRLILSDWRRMGFDRMDFSPAARRPRNENEKQPMRAPAILKFFGHTSYTVPPRDSGCITMDDPPPPAGASSNGDHEKHDKSEQKGIWLWGIFSRDEWREGFGDLPCIDPRGASIGVPPFFPVT